MSGWSSLFTQVLDGGDFLLALYKYLAKEWAVPKDLQEFTASCSLRSNTYSATGSVSDTVFPVIKVPGTLVLRGSKDLDNISLLVVNKDSLILSLHSLFQVG